MNTAIVSTQWLQDHLQDPDLVILDASIPVVGSNDATTETRCIKGARFFDLKKKFSDPDSDFPNTFPKALVFEQNARALGISNSSKIVVYDSKGIYSGPRVWWMFKTMGHKNVAVLDGGLPEWIKNGGEISYAFSEVPSEGDFTAKLLADNVKDFNYIQTHLTDKNKLIFDARSSGRFNGTAPEPRPELRSGCIPGSVNLPYTEVLNDGKMKNTKDLKALFDQFDTENKELIFSCGSGLTACIILLASALVNQNKKSVYDGSWTEWAQKIP